MTLKKLFGKKWIKGCFGTLRDLSAEHICDELEVVHLWTTVITKTIEWIKKSGNHGDVLSFLRSCHDVDRNADIPIFGMLRYFFISFYHNLYPYFHHVSAQGRTHASNPAKSSSESSVP